MILRSVEGIEAEPFGFHLGSLGHGESNLSEDGDDPAANVGQGMRATVQAGIRGQGGVDLFAKGLEVGPFVEGRESVAEKLLDPSLGLVEGLAEGGLLFLGQVGYSLGRLRHGAVGSEDGCLGLFPVRPGRNRLKACLRLGDNGLEILLHAEKKERALRPRLRLLPSRPVP